MTGAFADLFAEATRDRPRFGHREHVHLTWLAVRRYGMPAAIDEVSEGLRRTARYSGVPQKYSATMSRAWVELVAHHVEHSRHADFDRFAGENADLFDKRLLGRFYSSAVLAAGAARTSWVEPDRAPFPWSPSGP